MRQDGRTIENHPDQSYDEAGFWKRLTLLWVIPLFNKGFSKELDAEDLYACSVEDDPGKHADALER